MNQSLACGFCGRAYLRSDVLRRHFQICKQKGSVPAPTPAKPGRRRTACNACVEARLFCDGESACETCLQKGLDCSFTHMQEQSSGSGSPRKIPTIESSQSDRIAGPAKMAIPFLLHYADTGNEPEPGSLRLLAQCGTGDCAVNHDSHGVNMFAETWESLFNSFINPSTLSPSCGIQPSPTDRFGSELLESTSTRLLSLLTNSDRGPPDRVRPDLDRAEELFTPRNIGNFLEALLDNPFNAHFFHTASFNPNTASVNLLLTMVLLGATYITSHNASDLAQYSEIAESLIFDDPEFQTLVHGRNSSPPDERRILEMLQAALFAIIRRLRVQRFPAVITIIRTLNLTDITNDLIPYSSTWESYLLREGLVRVMTGIHLFNYYCIMFYRHPTQLRITEMTFEIPQRDDLYHARNATEWEQLSTMDSGTRDPMRLRTVIRDYMSAGNNHPDEGCYPKTPLGLFVVLSALHCVLFELLALHAVMNDAPGFIIHAVEYWWVAKALIQHPSAALVQGTESCNSRHGFRRLVERLGPAGLVRACPHAG
ncbi:hypothetical protein BO78DRAFT_409772 [Aspergillus sclerotiicarbonarius CBS 121057]|uniref:C2H2-type domain-containing protein n=1 Tax=Aspergillus sclerotiicarbonarius (strain CBS 121057 / IBT 28362) TaxID=1448318 RepID=A0A319ERU3_ASPSB|nr:hypothetical protein BO78DRAFT_409772 [Aspergillus sclerotiicarbonarius CBS 121057]